MRSNQIAPIQKPRFPPTRPKAFASVLKFPNGGTNPQQHACAMQGFAVYL
jgi:hypothetical protein